MKPNISERIVLPILDSMITNRGSLKSINLPDSFSSYEIERNLRLSQTLSNNTEYDKRSYINEFESRYMQYLLDQDFQCTKCSHDLVPRPVHRDPSYHYNEIQSHMCCECLSYFCTDEEPNDCDAMVTFCSECSKRTCSACVPSLFCNVCMAGYVCLHCRKQIKCESCGHMVCGDCYVTCDHCNRKGCWDCLAFAQCENKSCNKAHCGNCYEDGTNRDVKWCREGCRCQYCFDCRFSQCSTNWERACNACLLEIGISSSAAVKLQEEKDKAAAKLQEERDISNKKKQKLTEENIKLSEEYNLLRARMIGLKFSLDAALGE